MPEIWSELATLAVEQFAGFTMEMAAELLPKLRKLKKVTLPGRIDGSKHRTLFDIIKNEPSKSNDRNLFDTIEDELSSCGVMPHQAEITLKRLPLSESFATCHVLGPRR